MCLDLGPLRAKGKVGLKKAVRGMIVEDKPAIVVKEASDMKYTQRDAPIQSHPGYFAPKITPKPAAAQKKPKPPAAHSSRHKKSINEWLAVPVEDYASSAAPRRVNAYTQRKLDAEKEREKKDMVGGRRVNKYTKRKREEEREGLVGDAEV